MIVLFDTRRVEKAKGLDGLRWTAELLEIFRLRARGLGLVTGCTAGNTGAALVVTDR